MSPFRRSIVSFVANVLKAILSFASGVIIAKGLGPSDFGVFSFLLASFTALNSLLDMGTSSAFFSFVSKKVRSKTFIYMYLKWQIIQFFISSLFIILIAPDSWLLKIWEGEARERILLAFVAVFLQQQVWNTVSVLAESQRYTVRLQALNFLIALIHLIVIYSIYMIGGLSIEIVYWLIITEFIIVVLLALKVFPWVFDDYFERFKDVYKEYKIYCLPLIPYAWIGVVSGFADTWLLQHYGGAVEQAYYAVAVQFSAVSLIATTSILRILWKEVAEANYKKDFEQVRLLYERSNRILYFISASVTGFLIPWTEEIILLVLGEEYIGGVLVMSLMFLYPIHQSLGQISGTLYYALEKTRPYVIVGSVQMLISLLLAYFLLATSDAFLPGLNLGSLGLSFKMIALQFISVNVLIWWLSIKMGWEFRFVYQLIGIGVTLTAGYFVYWLAILALDYMNLVLYKVIISGLFYIIILLILVHLFPSILGLTKPELLRYSPLLKLYNK